MLNRGARYLVLVSRSGVTNGYQSLCLRKWAARGVKVIVSTRDATTVAGATELIREAKKLAPVGGIFNLAAVSFYNHFNYLTVDLFNSFTYLRIYFELEFQ